MKIKNKEFGLKGLQLQTVENEASQPLLVHTEYQPFRRFCQSNRSVKSNQINHIAELLECSYGYKTTLNTNGRNKRCSPSAGGLYPIYSMILIYLHEEWQLLYYSYEEHEFYTIPQETNNIKLVCSSSDTSKVYVFFIAVFWRTVQKYGVRGFRYSLLDAGIIIRYIDRIYKSVNPTGRIDLYFGKTKYQDLLPLKKGEEVVCSLTCDKNFNINISKQRIYPFHFNKKQNIGLVPCLSTNMIRVLDMSEYVFYNNISRFELITNEKISENIIYDIDARKSANGFSDDSLMETCLLQMKEACIKSGKEVEQQLGIAIKLACIVSQTDQQRDIIQIYDSNSALTCSFQLSNVSEKLEIACQNQAIMKNAAFTFMLFVVPSEIEEWSHHTYGISILASSFICADLYIEALHNHVGTTIIGGFSELKLMDMIKKDEVLPLVMQAFGVEGQNQKKIDAVYNEN